MRYRWGFTLVEIMIVVAVIGLISAIAITNFIRARQSTQATMCSQYLERIDGAKAQVAFVYNLGDLDIPADDQLAEFLNRPVALPIDGSTDLCPAGGAYSVNDLLTPPQCSLAAGPGEHRME